MGFLRFETFCAHSARIVFQDRVAVLQLCIYVHGPASLSLELGQKAIRFSPVHARRTAMPAILEVYRRRRGSVVVEATVVDRDFVLKVADTGP